MTRAEQLKAWERLQRLASYMAPRSKRRAAVLAELRAMTHSMLASDVGAQQMLMWVPIGLGVPEGWHLARQAPSHHSAWSQLIERDA